MSGSRGRTGLTADDGDGIREVLADDGFVQVCGVLPKDEVETVRRAIDEILDRYNQDSDILIDHDDVPRKICYPLGKSECLLAVLAHPSLGRVVEAVAGTQTEVVLTWEDILLKPAITAPTWWPHTHTRSARTWLAEPLDLRVQYTGDGIEYDLSSPYYHFG